MDSCDRQELTAHAGHVRQGGTLWDERRRSTTRTVVGMSDSTPTPAESGTFAEIDESTLDDVNAGASVDFSTEALRRLNGR